MAGTNKPDDYLDRCRSYCSVFLLLYILSHVSPKQVVVISTILAINSGACDQPIRLWLEVLLGIYALHLLLIVFSELSARTVKTSRFSLVSVAYSVIHVLMSLLTVVWFFLGNVWFYNEGGSCRGQG
jgi:hypothetical protein